MKVARMVALTTLMMVVVGGSALAQETRTVELKAHGGVSLTAPAYQELRRDDAVVVLEQLADPVQKKTFRVLVLSIEAAPARIEDDTWGKVRDNIVAAAQKSGRTLTLDAGAAYTDAAGFLGRRFVGGLSANSGGRAVSVELIALVKDGRLVTIGVIAERVDDPDRAVLDEVARSARLP